MIWLSLLLVFGTLALVGLGITSEVPSLELGAGLIIQGRVPWLLLGALWGGVALGVASLVRGRRLPRAAAVVLEIVPVAYVTWYILVGSALPAHELAIAVGDPFPGYALEDQDGKLHELGALEKRRPAYYVFYRGGW